MGSSFAASGGSRGPAAASPSAPAGPRSRSDTDDEVPRGFDPGDAPDPAGDAGWLLASLSDLRVGDDGTAGVVARVAGPDTDSVYRILRTALEPLGRELGAPPFAERGLA